MPQTKVLVVEDEANARAGLAELIASWGYRTETAADGAAGLDAVVRWSPDVVVTDLAMPRMDGLQLLDRISEMPQQVAVVVLTAQGSIDSAVDAMRMGAYDYLQKPVDPARLKTILNNVQQGAEVKEEVAKEESTAIESGKLGPLVGSSPQMREIFSVIERVAPNNVSVLITGESGTGKELAARALHMLSGRRNKPFVAVNCAAIPETLIESEIFGHERGAFTGAEGRRAGCFELAEEGTLLLDEIGEMPAATQSKLLRVLEDRRLRRLGSRDEIPVNVRVIAATNKDPQSAVASGELRADLYYRLNVFNIHMPPLRDHTEDIPAMANAMVSEMNARHGTSVPGIARGVITRFLECRWPGNARELRNTIERAVILAQDRPLDASHLPPSFGEEARTPVHTSTPALAASSTPLRDDMVHLSVGTTVDEAEKQLILKTLISTRNNKTRAADILGISSKTLQNKLKEYALEEREPVL